jgi:hypothetical protein
MKYFSKERKTLIRRVSDRVNNSMSVGDCYAFIRGALKAELDLHFLPGELSFKDKERVERDEANTEMYYKNILEYSEELALREINSTEDQLQQERDLVYIKDEIIDYIVKEYTFESSSMYETQRVIDKYVDNSKMNITMLPEVVWSTTWHPNHKEIKKLYNKYSK